MPSESSCMADRYGARFNQLLICSGVSLAEKIRDQSLKAGREKTFVRGCIVFHSTKSKNFIVVGSNS